MKMILSTLLCLITISVEAAEPKYLCYSGKIPYHKSIHDHILEIRIGLTKEAHGASFIAYYDEAKHQYSNDLFCPKKYIGRCVIVDDAGSLQIQSIKKNKMIIQFNGVPRLFVDAEGENTPMIDSSIKLKSPLKAILIAQPFKECSHVKRCLKSVCQDKHN